MTAYPITQQQNQPERNLIAQIILKAYQDVNYGRYDKEREQAREFLNSPYAAELAGMIDIDAKRFEEWSRGLQ